MYLGRAHIFCAQSVPMDIYDLYRAPALQNLFSVPGDIIESDHRPTIIYQISTFPWFNDEFIDANGFCWLESETTSPHNFYWYTRTIINASSRSRSFSELAQWMNCLKGCLVGTSPRRTISHYKELDTLKSILKEQCEQRSCNPAAQSNPSRYDYVRVWTELEWNDWQVYMEGLIKELENGHIFEQKPHFTMDPDGVCCTKPNGELR